MGASEQPDSGCLLLEMEETVSQLMISKFGRVINLEALQTLSVNTTLEELKIKKLRKELSNVKEMKMWEVRMRGQVTLWAEARAPGKLSGGPCRASLHLCSWSISQAPVSPTEFPHGLSQLPYHSLNWRYWSILG